MPETHIFTQYIDNEACIGDSLNIINLNYSNLDVGLIELSSTSHTWVINNSAELTNTAAWSMDVSAAVKDVIVYTQDVSSTNSNIITWMNETSSNTLNTTTWTNRNSAHHNEIYTWSWRNSAIISTLARNYYFEVTPTRTVFPVTASLNINSLNVKSKYGCLLAGSNNNLNGDYSVLVGGQNNSTIGTNSIVVGGTTNKVEGDGSSIVGGDTNTVTGAADFIGGGKINTIEGHNSSILGGLQNVIQSNYSHIAGGVNNISLHDNTFLVGSNITTLKADTTYVNSLNISDADVTIESDNVLFKDEEGNVRVGVLRNIHSYSLLCTLFGNVSASLRELIFNYNNNIIPQKYVESVVAASANQGFTILHNLNTLNCIIQGIDMTTNMDVSVSAIRVNKDQVYITTPTSGEYKVIVIG